MILKFPDLNTLRLALISGVVPSGVSLTPAIAGYDEQEALWVESSAALTRGVQNDLKKLGVQTARSSGSTATAEVSCWPELLPLQADKGPLDRPEQTPVLFDLPGGEGLSRLVIEILRLGNDRQSYRWLDGPDDSSRVLLRVVGPPYYSLLRALDRNDETASPRAFLERAPRVWVELGWTHPLVEQLKPAAGKLLFLQPPCRWTQIDEAPFRDIYDVLEFPLPVVPSRYREGQLAGRIQVTPSLKAGGSPDGAELWVLAGDAVEELNRFVQNADDQLLHRLAFAVGDREGQRTVVVRVRHSKLPPPVLVLNAVGYKPFLKLPNLFLPAGTRLHPPLRRDVVRKLLADDLAIVTWLDRGDDGSFAPRSLPEDAFRPLMDWVDYVLDRDNQALQAWVQAAQFDFEPFICDEEQLHKPKKPPSDKTRNPKKGGGDTEAPDAALFEYVDKSRKPYDKTVDLDPFSSIPQATPSELQKQLSALEEKFKSLPGGLDEPERQQLWPELAALNTGLGNAEDAGVCWINAMWNQERVGQAWTWNWFSAEAKSVPFRKEPGFPRGRSWVTQLTLAPEKAGEVNGPDLDRLLALDEPSAADVRALAAYVVWASGRSPASPALLERIQPVQHFLETHERLLPVRAAWLAWSHLVQLSRGDVLALARTRDRLLERLFNNGMRPELDLPGFLRFAGQPGSTRFRGVRQWLMQICELARKWSDNPENRSITGKGHTKAYIDLIFAFGLARLGEHDACRNVLERAKEVLGEEPDPHSFLLQAYAFRINQIIEGRPLTGALPPEQMEYLEAHVSKLERYTVDRMRQFSRILEPDTKLDPYRHWGARISDLDKELTELADLFDRKEVTERVAKLLRNLPKSATGTENRAKILSKSLEIAPRVSEDFSRSILDLVTTTFDALPEPRDVTTFLDRAELLEKALFVAAHFDRLEHIQPLVSRFQTMLESRQSDYAVQAMDKLAGRCLRGLRKLGMRDQIEHLLTVMETLILGGKDLKSFAAKGGPATPSSLRALLHVAGGWYYFGRDTKAEPVMQAARSLLLQKELEPKEKTQLAVVFAATLGQAPVEVAQKRLEELFTKAEGFRDGYTTATYYSRFQLEVVEAVVLAVVSDDFTMGSQARRWLDDDEFLVRRRIHSDLKAIMAHG